MAKPDIVKLTLRNLPDSGTGLYDLSNLDRHISAIAKSAKSAINPSDFIQIRDKIIDEVSGEAIVEILTESVNATNIQNAIASKIGNITGKSGASYSISNPTKMPIKSGEIAGLYGTKAVELARQNVETRGGRLTYAPTADSPDRYEYIIPYEGRYTQKRRQEMESNLFSEPLSVSASTRIEEANKRQKEEEKREKKDKDKSDREKKGAILKILGVVTVLTDVARRILTSVLNFATQSVQTATMAHNLGMSYSTAREFGIQEKVHGLPAGTITGAISDIQSMFGNIQNLDENAISALALIMGSDVESLIRSGIGGSRPEELLGNILDAYMERAQSGRTSLGQYVGEQEARRELFSQLSKISPQIASLFATMQEERNNINSIYKDQASTFAEWRKLFDPNRGGITSLDEGVVETLGQYTNQIKGIAEQIKQGVMIKVAPTLIDVLQKIANTRFGMTTRESWEADDINREANKNFILQIDKQLELFPDLGYDPLSPTLSREQRAQQAIRQVLLNAKADAEKENQKLSGVGNKTKTMPYLLAIASQNAQDTYRDIWLSQGIDNIGMFDTDLMWEVIGRFVPEAKIEGVKQDLVKQRLKELQKSKIADKQKRKKEIIESLGENVTFEQTHQALAEAGLGEFGTKESRTWYGKKITERTWTDLSGVLTKEELAELESGITVDDLSLLEAIYNKYGNSRGLYNATYEINRDEIKTAVQRSELFAESLIPSDYADLGSGLSVGSYNVVAGTDEGGTYRIVLDVNNDGKAELSDLVLFESQGASFFEGNMELKGTINKEGKLKLDATGTSASEAR